MRYAQSLVNLLVMVAIVGIPYLGWLGYFTYTIPVLLLVWWALRFQDQSFTDIGWDLKRLSWKFVGIGMLAGVGLFVVLQVLFWPAIDAIFTLEGEEPGINDFLRQNLFTFLFTLVMSWLVGGGYETVVFHGFMYTKLKNLFPGKQSALTVFLLTTTIFAGYHYTMGWIGVYNAFLAGAFYLGLVVRFNGILWPTIFCHATYNTLVIVGLYMGWL
jgi:membrane protease YdiL (CAAX protease family)